MVDDPSPVSKDQSAGAVQPEVLRPQEDSSQSEAEANATTDPAAGTAEGTATSGQKGASDKPPVRSRRTAYRPNHKATFIGLAVVIAILAVNAVIITFVIKSQSKHGGNALQSQGQVTIDQHALDKLGVNRTAVGNEGIELTVNPDAVFKGKLQVGGDVSIGGTLKLNSTFSATSASLARLDAGETSLNSLNVNGDATASNLNLRNGLSVTGTSRLQGDVVIGRLLTVNNNVNVTGSLAVGGALTVNTLQVRSLVADTSLTVEGHFITRGSAPGVSVGPAAGSNGTVSISGNDAVGTIGFNAGTGAGNGVVANVSFRAPYSATPHVVVTAVGASPGNVYVNRTGNGFSVGVSGSVTPGGYAFDYIVMQ